MAETEAALERSRLRCVELQRRVGELQAAAGGAQSATAAARVTELEAELAQARARITELEAASADVSAPVRVTELEAELAQTRTRVAQLEGVREQLEAGTAQHGRELEQARKQTVQLDAELAQARAQIGQLEAAKLETARAGVRDPGAPLFRFEAHAADSSHLLFAPVDNGYLLFEQDGPPPKPETLLAFVDGNGVTSRFRVAEVGAPPLPGITLACGYLVEAD
jgi:multidrug efflux pump subunit AcrA (membrane-fusion protein)